MITKRFTSTFLVLSLVLFLSACGLGQAFGPAIKSTPLPTFTATPTIVTFEMISLKNGFVQFSINDSFCGGRPCVKYGNAEGDLIYTYKDDGSLFFYFNLGPDHNKNKLQVVNTIVTALYPESIANAINSDIDTNLKVGKTIDEKDYYMYLQEPDYKKDYWFGLVIYPVR